MRPSVAARPLSDAHLPERLDRLRAEWAARPGPREWGTLTELRLPDGTRLVARDSHADGGASGPTVVALHGLGGSDQGLRTVVAPVALGGTRVVAPNLPGMGVTPVQSPRADLNYLLDLVVQTIELVSLGAPVVLVGHSFGSTLCAHLAARRPELVAQLVLLCPVTRAPARQPGRRAAFEIRGADGWQKLVARMPQPWGHRALLVGGIASNTALTRQGVGGRVRISRGSKELLPAPKDLDYFFLQHVEASRHDAAEVASEISVPATIVSGTRDPFAPGSSAADLADAMGARLVSVPGAGHLAQHETPGPLIAALSDAVAAAA